MQECAEGSTFRSFTRPRSCNNLFFLYISIRRAADGLFLDAVSDIAVRYPDVSWVDISLDKACLQVPGFIYRFLDSAKPVNFFQNSHGNAKFVRRYYQ